MVLYYRRRVLRHTAHIAVYQSLSVRAVASRYTPSTDDTSSLNSVVIALEVENVNTVSCILLLENLTCSVATDRSAAYITHYRAML